MSSSLLIIFLRCRECKRMLKASSIEYRFQILGMDHYINSISTLLEMDEYKIQS